MLSTPESCAPGNGVFAHGELKPSLGEEETSKLTVVLEVYWLAQSMLPSRSGYSHWFMSADSFRTRSAAEPLEDLQLEPLSGSKAAFLSAP